MLGARGVQETEVFVYMKQYCLYTEQVTFNAHRPGGSKIELVRPTACGRKGGGEEVFRGMPRKENLML